MVNDEPCVIRARGLQLASARGQVYGPVDLDVPAGRLVGLVSPEGGGRTSLLLTLAGRMRFTAGTLAVLDRPLPHSTAYVQGHSALANFADIDAPDDGLTPRELFRERAGLLVPLWRRVPGWDDPSVQGPLEQVFADRTPPAPDEQIWRLEALDRTLLAISLALLGRPHLLVVDDIDALHHPADQLVTWRALQRLTSPDLTIVASAAARELVPPEVEAIDPHGTLPVPARFADAPLPSGRSADAPLPSGRSADAPLPPATPIEVP